MIPRVRVLGVRRRSGRFVRLAIVPVLLSLVAGCGGGGSSSGGGGVSSPTITSVSVTCAITTVAVGKASQCSATVTGTGNYSSAVTWAVNGTTGGNATYGSISANGLYQTPATVPAPATIQISATSVQDSTKSNSTQILAVLSIAIAPLTPSIQLFHSQQFSATVQGVSNTAVTWSVNGISGGNSAVGQISTNGLYSPPAVLPSPATATVSAISLADSTQSASTTVTLAADTTALNVVSVSPTNNATGVPSQTAVSIVFNEALNPSTIGPGAITLSEGKTTIPLQFSYDASSYTLTLTPLVLLDPQTAVTLSVASQLQDLGGNSLASAYSSTFTTVGPSSISGNVTPPNGVSANSLSAIGFQGQKSTIDTTGAFTTSISAVGVTVISVPLPSEASGLMALAISSTGSSSGAASATARAVLSAKGSPVSLSRASVHVLEHQITASQMAASSPSLVVVDFQTTAEAILFLSPALYRQDTAGASAIMAVIAADSNTQALATALGLAWNEPHPLQDPNVASAYTTALTSILASLINQPGASAVSQAQLATPRNSIASGNTAQASTLSSVPAYQSIDVCCISTSQFAASGSNYISTVSVNGASLTNVLGNAAGWVMRVVPLASNFSSGQLQPINGNSSAPDSPGPVTGENNTDQQPLTWIPGNSVLQYANLSGDVNLVASWLTGVFFSQTPVSNPQATVTVPQTQPEFYLVRYFSGGTADSNEFPLVSSPYNNTSPSSGGIYEGQQLWAGALVANYATNIAGIVLAGQPDDISTCLAQGIISDPAFANSILNISPQTAGNWNGLMQVTSTLSSGFQDVVPSCIADSGEQQAFEMALDVAGMSSGVGDIVDGVSEAAQIGTVAQMMAELFTRDSPVDTAYIQVGAPPSSSPASVQVSPATLSLTVGGSVSLTATALDSSQKPISQASFSWSSSNQAIAQVSGNGSTIAVTGIASGVSTIIATASDGATGTATITVTVPQVQNLPAPTLLSPANNAIGIPSNPTFSWSSVTGNAGYRIMLATNATALPVSSSSSSCGTCLVNTVVTGTNYVLTAPLAPGTKYFWEVHALTPLSNPGYGTWSSIFGFTTGAFSAVDPYIPYSDITPKLPTTADVVNAAMNYVGAQWGGYNCTGLVWAVSDAIGADYYESAQTVANDAHESTQQVKTTVPDPGNPPAVPATPSSFPGYTVPPRSPEPDVSSNWTTFTSTIGGSDKGWTYDVAIGDIVRIPTSAIAEGIAHSFIVVGGDQQSGWEVIDDTDPSGAANPVTVSEHTFANPNNELYKEILSANVAYISYLTPPTGGSEVGLTRITNDANTDDVPKWSPDNKSIVFASSSSGANPDLWEVSPDGTGLQQLTTGNHGNYGGGIQNPVWLSSTGDLVVLDTVYYWEWDRFTLSANPSLPVDHAVANGSQPDFEQLLFVPGGLGGQWLAVSPDGTTLAWDALTTLTGQCPSHTDLHVAPLSALTGQDNNTEGQVIASFNLNCSVGNMEGVVGLSFSPDGSELVVATLADSNDYAFDLSIYKLDGTLVRNLTTSGASSNHIVNWQPSWSSDNRIAFSSNSSGQFQIYTINSDGTNLTQVTTNGGAWPNWAPDASHITFSSSRSGNSQIYVIPAPASGSGTTASVAASCTPANTATGEASFCEGERHLSRK